MKNKIVLVLTGVILLTAGSSFAAWGKKDKMCEKGGMGKGMEHGLEGVGNWEKMAAELELSDKQKEEVREQKHQSQRENIKNQAELKLKMHDLKYELMKDKVEDAKVDKLIDEVSQAQKQALKNKINSMRDFRKVLNKQQWEKMKEMKSKHMEMKKMNHKKDGYKKDRKGK